MTIHEHSESFEVRSDDGTPPHYFYFDDNAKRRQVSGRGTRDQASAVLFEAIYESGADIITDADRATAGLPVRGAYGITAEELRIMEARHTEAMLRPLPPFMMKA